MKKQYYIFYCLFTFTCYLIITSCTPNLKVPTPSAGTANFSKVIAIGGDYMAGYQDGALYNKGQQLCIPALLAEQFKTVGGSTFNQAVMPDNKGLGLGATPWDPRFFTAFHLGNKRDCLGVTSLNPLNDSISPGAASPYLTGIAGNSIQNLAVPFANTAQYFNPAFGNSFSSGNKNPYYNRIASLPGVSTIYGDAKAQNATFIDAWLGMEDIFNYASNGGASTPIPSSAVLSARLDSILGGLTSNGAKGVIANIPDFRNFPFYTLVGWNAAVITRQGQADTLNNFYITLAGYTQIHFGIGSNGFIIHDATVSNGGIRQMHNGEYILLDVPLDSMKCDKYGVFVNALNNQYVLDSTEVYAIDQATNSYNDVIAQKAAQYNLALVDMHSYFNSVKSGFVWDGASFNASFVTGGFFSLDGYHPNQKGYALIANEFIKAINNKYQAAIPAVYCTQCDGILFP